MQHRMRATRILVVGLVIALVSITLVAAAVYYYYTAQVQVNVETPRITWLTGSDITASIGTNETWCQITIGNLEPNATTVYTNALRFTVNNASTASGMALQVATVLDSNTIIWGIRLYVFTQGASSTSLTLVDGGNVTIGSTNGSGNVTAVGYRQSGASASYGSTSVPTQSSGFTGAASTTYIIAIEVMGRDGILTTQSATMQLKLLWS